MTKLLYPPVNAIKLDVFFMKDPKSLFACSKQSFTTILEKKIKFETKKYGLNEDMR